MKKTNLLNLYLNLQMSNNEDVFIGLNKRAMNIVREMGITSLAELADVSEAKLMQYRNCKRHTVQEIRFFLDTYYYNQ